MAGYLLASDNLYVLPKYVPLLNYISSPPARHCLFPLCRSPCPVPRSPFPLYNLPLSLSIPAAETNDDIISSHTSSGRGQLITSRTNFL